MTVLLRDLSIALDDDVASRTEPSLLARFVARHLKVGRDRVRELRVARRSLDARRGRPPRYLYSLELELDPEVEKALLARKRAPVELPRAMPPSWTASPLRAVASRLVVVGSGPAGLLAAHRLAQAGVPPLIVERGPEVRTRSKRWHEFLRGGEFDPECNLLFGEGGAGTYSDGKLTTRGRDPRNREVLELLAACGAPGEILVESKPHIGSNLLPSVVRRLRQELVERGVEFRFDTRLADLHTEAGRVRGAVLAPGGELECEAIFLGIGHSARDTFAVLQRAGVALEPKPFQMGARVEHPQAVIDALQYGESCGHPALPPADYRFVERRRDGDLFSFCMCPGGEILPAVERPGAACVNGASRHRRTSPFANSGFVVTVEPRAFHRPGDALSGVRFQEEVETRAARLAQHPFGAPALRLTDFLARGVSRELPPCSYPLPLTPAPFEEFLPAAVVSGLRDGLERLCGRLPAFRCEEAIIVGPESRSSSPVRIARDPKTLVSTSVRGLYPMGEGAGYAGGILSAAVDGMRCAEAFVEACATSSAGPPGGPR